MTELGKIVRKLEEAKALAGGTGQQLLTYLIVMAIVEARERTGLTTQPNPER
jgi:hypothetical protein